MSLTNSLAKPYVAGLTRSTLVLTEHISSIYIYLCGTQDHTLLRQVGGVKWHPFPNTVTNCNEHKKSLKTKPYAAVITSTVKECPPSIVRDLLQLLAVHYKFSLFYYKCKKCQ